MLTHDPAALLVQQPAKAGRVARVRCLMMQRDETALIGPWLGYHGYLFGFENLVVFDNGSQEREVVETLRRSARAGSTIIWHHKTDEDFEARHTRFATAVARWDEDDYDLAIGLEAGEFLTVFTRHGLSCRRDEVDTYLEMLRGTAERFEIGFAFSNVPLFPGFYTGQPISRVFTGVRIAGDQRDRQHPEAAGRVQSTELACVRCRPMSEPLTPSSQAEWRDRVVADTLVGLPSLTNLADALGLDPGFFGTVSGSSGHGRTDVHPLLPPGRRDRRRPTAVFDGDAYLAKNPDVAASSWPALKHFLIHGHSEKRPYGA